MRIIYHRDFEKQYKKLKPSEKKRFKERQIIFENSPFDPILKNHSLRGDQAGSRSIHIGGDLRAHYKQLDPDAVIFVAIGTHHELYGK